MRVLFVGGNRGGGGTESHFVALARALADAGHDVTAAVRPDDFIHRGLAGDHRIRLLPIEFRSRRDLRAIRRLTEFARELRPDWIVGAFKAEYWALALVAKLARAPLVLFSHLDQRIRPIMLDSRASLVQGVIVPSQYLRQRKLARGLPWSQVVVLGNPVDVDRLRPDAALRRRTRASLGLRDDDLLLGFVGRIEPAKGVETLARALDRAMQREPRLHALWVGQGESESALRELSSSSACGGRHHWLPWLEDVHPAYAAMDMLALPSEGCETFGRVLVEAQACGVPVLGARIGGIPEALVDGVTGRLLPPGDVDAWADAIEELAKDQTTRDRFAASGRSFALRFDSRRIAASFLAILDSLDAPPPARVALPSTVRLARTAAAD